MSDNPGKTPFEVICRRVMKYTPPGTEPLPPPWCEDPEYQAALALWKLILYPGGAKAVRLQALREYYDRTRGKADSHGDSVSAGQELDLSQLSVDERSELVRLLDKAGAKETDEQ